MSDATDSAKSLSPWTKVDPAHLEAPSGKAVDERDLQEKTKTPWSRLRWISLDSIAVFLWAYSLIKVFVGDVDRWLVSTVAPPLIWLVEYRLLLLLVVFSILALVVGRHKRWLWILIYIALFPLVVLFWKLPRFFYRRGSWDLVFGSLHAVVGFLGSLRYSIPVATCFLLAGLVVLIRAPEPIVWTALTALMLAWLLTLGRALILAVRPSRFLKGQQNIFRILLSSESMEKLYKPEDWMRDPEIQVFELSQAQQLAAKAGTGLIAYRAAQFWAMKLDRYRRSGIPVVFSVATVVILVLYALATFTLVNAAILQLDPQQFVFSSTPSPASLAYYSLASLFVNEISALAAAGWLTFLVNVVAGLSTGFIALVVIISLTLGFRQAKENEVAMSQIRAMRRRADEFAAWLGQEHELSVQELLERVEKVGFAFMGLLTYLTQNLAESQEDYTRPESN